MNFTREKNPLRALDIGMYIYDNGFGPRWYICSNWDCGSTKLKRVVKGGFQPPYYICQDCGMISNSPLWVDLDPETGEPNKDEIENLFFKNPKNVRI